MNGVDVDRVWCILPCRAQILSRYNRPFLNPENEDGSMARALINLSSLVFIIDSRDGFLH